MLSAQTGILEVQLISDIESTYSRCISVEQCIEQYPDSKQVVSFLIYTYVLVEQYTSNSFIE